MNVKCLLTAKDLTGTDWQWGSLMILMHCSIDMFIIEWIRGGHGDGQGLELLGGCRSQRACP